MMLLPSLGIDDISLEKHLAFANNQIMNADCLSIKTEAASYSISYSSDQSTFGSGTWTHRS
jgi:hypothetical protein